MVLRAFHYTSTINYSTKEITFVGLIIGSKECFAFPKHLIVLPLSLESISTSGSQCSRAFSGSIEELSNVLISITVCHRTHALHRIIAEMSLIHISIGEDLFSEPMFHIILPLSFVNCSVVFIVYASAFLLHTFSKYFEIFIVMFVKAKLLIGTLAAIENF